MKKRMLSILLFISLLSGLLPVSALALHDPVIRPYSPRETQTVVLPAVLWNKKGYMTGADLRLSEANYINDPRIDGGKDDTALDGSETYKDFATNGTQRVQLDSTIAANTGAQICWTFGARGRAGKSLSSSAPNPYTEISINGDIPLASHNINQYYSMGLYRGANNFTRLLQGNEITIRAETFEEHWYTPATLTKDLALYLFDDRAPYLDRCEITDTDTGSPVACVKAGTAIDFNLYFNEFIRFADDKDQAPKLEFKVAAETARDMITQYADFISLTDNKMVFRYTVPLDYTHVDEMYRGINNFRIAEIPPLCENRDFGKKFTLQLLPAECAATMKAGELTVDNLITDLAGNPVGPHPVFGGSDRPEPAGSFRVTNGTVVFDMKAPEVRAVSVSKHPTATDEKGKAVPYAKTQDQLICTLQFDEPVYAEAGAITITYNLKDSGGRFLTASNVSRAEGDATVLFTPVTIPEGAVREGGLLPAAPEGLQPVPILDLLTVDASRVTDKAGWTGSEQDMVADRIFPAAQWMLDSLPPQVTMPMSGEKVSPRTNFEDETIFCVPVKIIDTPAAGIEASGTDNQQGWFQLMGFPERAIQKRDGLPNMITETQDYSYYVSTDGTLLDADLADRWISVHNERFCEIQKNTFEQFSGTEGAEYSLYLYVKIPKAELKALELRIVARDRAGNVTDLTRRVDYVLDLTPPTFWRHSDLTIAAEGADTFSLSQSVTFCDPSGIDPDSVRVTAADGSFTDLGLGAHTQADLTYAADPDNPAYTTFTLKWKGLRKGDVLDTSTTWTVKDKSTTPNSFTYGPIPFRYSLVTACRVTDTSPEAKPGYFDRLHLQKRTDPSATDATCTVVLVRDPDNPRGWAGCEVRKGTAGLEPDGQNLLGGNRHMFSWSYYEDTDPAAGETLQNEVLLTPVPGRSTDFLYKMSGEDPNDDSAYLNTVSYKMISGEGLTLDAFTTNTKIDFPLDIRGDTRRIVRIGRGDDMTLDFSVTPVGWNFHPRQGDLTAMPETGSALPETLPHEVNGKQVKVHLAIRRPAEWKEPLTWDDVQSASLHIKGYTMENGQKVYRTLYETPLALQNEQTVTINGFRPELLDGVQSYNFGVSVTYKCNTAVQGVAGGVFSATDSGGPGSFDLFGSRGWDYPVQLRTFWGVKDPENNSKWIDHGIHVNRSFTSEVETVQELGAAAVLPLTVSPSVAYQFWWGAQLVFHNPNAVSLGPGFDNYNWTRVWNATGLADETAARDAAVWKNTMTPVDWGHIPIGATEYRFDRLSLQEGLNTIRYQSFNYSDGLSQPRTVLVEVSLVQPTLELGFEPANDSGFAPERTLRAGKAQDRLGSPLTVWYYNGTGFEELAADLKVSDTKNRLFYVIDSGGGVRTVTMQAENIDSDPPAIRDLELHPYAANQIRFTLVDPDTTQTRVREQIYVRYDDPAYRTVLKKYGLATDEDGWFQITGTGDEYDFVPNACCGTDMFEVHAGSGGYSVVMNLIAPKGSGGYHGTVSFCCVDRAGNRSAVVTSPAVTVDEMDLQSGWFEYTTANPADGEHHDPSELFFPRMRVLLDSAAVPAELEVRDVGTRGGRRSSGPSDRIDALPVYAPGDYMLPVRDAFGSVHNVQYTVPAEAFHGDSLQVSSVMAEENGREIVKLTIKSPTDNQFKVGLPGTADYDGAELPPLDAALTAGEATVRLPDGKQGAFGEFYTEVILHVTKNGVFKVLINNDAGKVTERLVSALGHQEPIALEEFWDYPNGELTDETTGKRYTEGYATVTVESADPARQVVGNNVCTFTYPEPVGTAKTLTITDDRGRMQRHTVTLETEIREAAEPYPDPPDLTVILSGERGGRMSPIGMLDAADPDPNHSHTALIRGYGPCTGYQLAAAAATPNAVKTVLLDYQADTSQLEFAAARSAVVDGVTISDNLLTVRREDARFSLVLVDENNRKSPRMDFGGGFALDLTPPAVGAVTRKVEGYGSVTLTIPVTDNESSFEQIEPVSPGGVRRESGVFVYSATDNRTIAFVFRDRCGNLVTHTEGITEVDKTAPSAEVRAWSPYAEGSQLQPPVRTNRDVTAYLSFDKGIRTMSLTVVTGDPDSAVLIKESETSARVVFSKDAKVAVDYQALNMVRGPQLTLTIPEGTIDRIPAVVTSSVTELKRGTARDPYAAEIELYAAGEPLYYGGRTITENDRLVVRVTENGTYHYRFTDEAGNIVISEVTVGNLNTRPLELKLVSLDHAGKTFTLHVNKPAVLTLPAGLTTGNPSVTKPDGDDLVLTAAKAGFYTVLAEDHAGNQSYCYVNLAPGDVIPPVMLQKTGYSYVRQGTPPGTVTDDLLLEGLRVTDESPFTLSVDRSRLPADFNTVGTFAYTVTAADEAGNRSELRRYVSVYPKSMTTVLVDGAFAKHTGVLSTAAGAHPITVSLPDSSVGISGHEPYRVYCAKGFYTPGEMKPFLHPLAAAGPVTGAGDRYEYDFSQTGWYTIYVLRQNREVFLTHLLVQ